MYHHADFRRQFGGTALAIRPRGEPAQVQLNQVRLRPGDALLIEIPRDRLLPLQESGAFLLTSQSALAKPRLEKCGSAWRSWPESSGRALPDSRPSR